jgi:hypothetical protein
MRRFKKTLKFLKKHVHKDQSIIDLGIENPLSEYMKINGYSVYNTGTVDLDNPFIKGINPFGVITSFEVFEHLLAPYNFLRNHDGKLIASVPLKVPINNAVWVDGDDWACHYHEFERRQFDMLLRRTGWKIKASEVWYGPDKLRFGIRPFLRFFFPCYYIIYAVKE